LGEDDRGIERCESESRAPPDDGDPDAIFVLDLDSGMGMGVAAEICVDVARSVSRASSIALTHSCTSCGVDAWR